MKQLLIVALILFFSGQAWAQQQVFLDWLPSAEADFDHHIAYWCNPGEDIDLTDPAGCNRAANHGKWNPNTTVVEGHVRASIQPPVDGQVFFVTAVDTTGNESGESNRAIWAEAPPPPPPADTTPPAPPKGLGFVVTKVEPPPPPPSGAVFLTEDFESGVYPPPGWEWNSVWDCATGREPGCQEPPGNPSGTTGNGWKLTLFAPSVSNTAAIRKAFIPQTEVWARFYIMFEDFNQFWCGGSRNGAEKIFYLTAFSGGRMKWRVQFAVSSVGGTTGEPYFDLWRHGIALAPEPKILFVKDVWYRVELHVRMSTTEAASDGEVNMWIDGVKVLNYTDRNGNPISNTNMIPNYETNSFGAPVGFETTPMDRAWITAFWGGGTCDHSPGDQFVWYDDLVVKTGPIGVFGPP